MIAKKEKKKAIVLKIYCNIFKKYFSYSVSLING